MQGSDTTNIVRFGVFEVDLRARELRRQGAKIKLQDQPFEVLAMLLERPGQVVSREELRDRVWPAGVFVDFDKSLSKAINKVREALGDSPETPRFIETLARRGYRFLAPVESFAPSPMTAPPRRRWFDWRFVATLGVIAMVGVGAWRIIKRGAERHGESDLIAVPLTTYPGRQLHPSFSPDGNQVAFAWDGPQQDNLDIYIKLIGTENLLRLTSDPAVDYAPAWSPDGRSIAFYRRINKERAAVLLVPSIGGPPERRLTETVALDDGKLGGASPGLSWSPDGKWLALKDRQAGEAQDSIFLLSIETGEKSRLSHPPTNCGDGTPAFSPDGKHLAFSRTFTFGVSEVFTVDLADDLTAKAAARQITFRKQRTSGLAWTADGREIVFSSGSNWSSGAVQLWRVSATGSESPHTLAVAGEHGRWPAISRQGNRLAFSREYADDENVWRLELAGQNRTAGKSLKLIGSTRNDRDPQYSPDGKRVVFISQRTGGDEVWVCNNDGSGPVQLTSLRAAITGAPRWSPDGTRIVFDSNVAGRFDVYVVDASGGPPKRLSNDPADEAMASWSRDGRSIYFVSNRTKNWEVWKMSADGGEAKQVTRNGGYVAFESADGAFLYYTKHLEAGKLWRMAVTGSEETEVLGNVDGGSYAVLDDGIYFIRPPAEERSYPALEFLSFATGKVQLIAPIPQLARHRGLSISQDHLYALYTQEDQVSGVDLMLVDHVR